MASFNPAKTAAAAQRPAVRPRGHSQTGTRAGRGRPARERKRALSSTHNLPVSPDSLSDGRRRTGDRRSKARWKSPVRGARAMSDKVDEGSERAPWYDGSGAAKTEVDARRGSLGMEFRTAFLKGCGNSGRNVSSNTRPVRSGRESGVGKA